MDEKLNILIDGIELNNLLILEHELARISEGYKKGMGKKEFEVVRESHLNALDRLALVLLHSKISFFNVEDEYYDYFANVKTMFKKELIDRQKWKNITSLLAVWKLLDDEYVK